MGDFDRKTSDPADKSGETRKLVIVLALGAVLVGLVALQLIKKGDGPQSAAAAPVTGGAALPPAVLSTEISPQALASMMAQLQNDPTQPLLRGDRQDDHSLDTVPHNPFAMSGGWLKALAGPDPEAVPAIHPSAIIDPAPVKPQPTAMRPRAEDFKLSSIFNGDMAIINGKVVRVGDVLNKARVVQIRDDAVVLQAADAPGGPTTEISTTPRLNPEN